MSTRRVPFRSGPWRDPVAPADAESVNGVAIVERLASRADSFGALVRLADGQLAVLGTVWASGQDELVKLFAKRRAAHAANAPERAWWRSVGDAAIA